MQTLWIVSNASTVGNTSMKALTSPSKYANLWPQVSGARVSCSGSTALGEAAATAPVRAAHQAITIKKQAWIKEYADRLADYRKEPSEVNRGTHAWLAYVETCAANQIEKGLGAFLSGSRAAIAKDIMDAAAVARRAPHAAPAPIIQAMAAALRHPAPKRG